MITKTLAIALLILSCAGCNMKGRSAEDVKKGELRHAIFVECMELAAKMPRQGDDDVSDIVGECSGEAYYMANQMSK